MPILSQFSRGPAETRLEVALTKRISFEFFVRRPETTFPYIYSDGISAITSPGKISTFELTARTPEATGGNTARCILMPETVAIKNVRSRGAGAPRKGRLARVASICRGRCLFSYPGSVGAKWPSWTV